MSVRPVETLTMVPRLNEAARLHQHAEVSPYAAQHATAVAAAEKAARQQQQVNQGQGAEHAAIRKESEKKGGGGQQPGADPQKRQGAQPQPQPKTAKPAGRLDVKI